MSDCNDYVQLFNTFSSLIDSNRLGILAQKDNSFILNFIKEFPVFSTQMISLLATSKQIEKQNLAFNILSKKNIVEEVCMNYSHREFRNNADIYPSIFKSPSDKIQNLISKRLPLDKLELEKISRLIGLLKPQYRNSNHIISHLKNEIMFNQDYKNRWNRKNSSETEWKGYEMLNVLELLEPDVVFDILYNELTEENNAWMLFKLAHKASFISDSLCHTNDEYKERFVELIKNMNAYQQRVIFETSNNERYLTNSNQDYLNKILNKRNIFSNNTNLSI